MSHRHTRDCYDDPGPGHGPPQLVCGQVEDRRPRPNDAYDAAKCGVCGRPWDEHDASCARHDFRPKEVTV